MTKMMPVIFHSTQFNFILDHGILTENIWHAMKKYFLGAKNH